MTQCRSIQQPSVLALWLTAVVLWTTVGPRVAGAELRATLNGSSNILSWAQDTNHDFYLQVSTNLLDPAGWRLVTNAPALAGGEYRTVLGREGTQRFYRLKAWEVLFDGTSTTAFRGYRQTTFPSNAWVMTAAKELKTVTGSAQGYIITTNQYGDFELTWEWKTATAGNGGVLYRVTEYYDQAHKSAPEYQLIDDAGYSLPANQALGSAYALIAPTNRVTVATGEWNQCRLLVRSNHVEHWLNARRIAQYELNSPAFNALVAGSSQFSAYASQYGKAAKGYIAFQNWTPEIWYRNMKVRTLPPE